MRPGLVDGLRSGRGFTVRYRGVRSSVMLLASVTQSAAGNKKPPGTEVPDGLGKWCSYRMSLSSAGITLISISTALTLLASSSFLRLSMNAMILSCFALSVVALSSS